MLYTHYRIERIEKFRISRRIAKFGIYKTISNLKVRNSPGLKVRS